MRVAPLAFVLFVPLTASAAPESAVFAGKPLSHWIALLKDENPLLREEAAAVLAEMGAPARDALPALLPLLKAPDARLRLRTAAAVWKIDRQPKDILPVLLDALRDADGEGRAQAIRLLEGMGTSALPAAPSLVAILDDDDLQTRSQAANALRQMGVDAVPAVIAGLTKNGPVGRSQCVQLLHGHGTVNRAVMDALAERLKDADKKVRLDAARALLTNVAHRKEVVATLADAARDSDPLYRRFAVASVFMVSPRPRELLEVFGGLLDDPDPVVAGNSAQAVWELSKDARRIVPTLNRVLSDPNGASSFAAVITLRQMGPAALPCLPALLNMPTNDPFMLGEIVRGIGPEALPDLLAAAGSRSSPMTRRKAVELLGYAGPDALPILLKMINDPNAPLRESAVRSVGAVGPKAKEALPTLLKLAEDKDVNLRSAALASLGKLGAEGKPAVPLLLASLKDTNPNVRFTAVTALGLVPLEAKTAVPALDDAIKAETIAFTRMPALQLRLKLDSDVAPLTPAIGDMLKESVNQQQLITLLGKLGPNARPLLPALVDLANNEARSPYSQLPLITALADIDPEGKTIVPALTRFLRDRDRGVRQAALTALAKFGQECDVSPLMADLRTNDVIQRRSIHLALRQLGTKAKGATKTLQELVSGPDGPARLEAAETLCKVAPDQAEVGKRVLLDALGGGPTAKLEIARSLLAVDGTNERALKAFEESLRGDDMTRRFAALNVLGQADSSAKAVLPVLKPLLKDASPPVRVWSARAYWKVSGETGPAAAVFVAVLQDKENMPLHQSAVQFLGELGKDAKSAVPLLTAMLKEKPSRLRPWVVDALRKIDPDAARIAEMP